MNRDVRVYIEDVLESISAIEEYTQTITEEEFYVNRQVQDAVLRRFEIIGEAVKNIDKNFKGKYPNIPWKSIAGMRDVLIHEYFGVNLKRVWNVIKTDIPILKQEFLRIKEQEKSS